jgi:aminopeptidase YwaD
MYRKFLALLIIVSSALTLALAQQPAARTSSADRLRRTVTYLASDMLEGRRTGTPGANDAAHYISGEFSLLGLRPGMQMAGPARTRGEVRARFLQPFPYVSTAVIGKGNQFLLNGHPIDGVAVKTGEDWMPLGFSSNASMKAVGVTFVGYGISSSELKYDDYSISNTKDRVAIAFAGTPDGDNPHGQFTQAGQIRFKAAAARAVGARALLIITNEEKLADDRLSNLSYDNAGEAGIPVAVISRKLAQQLLPAGNLTEYQSVADIRVVKSSAADAMQTPGTPRGLQLRTNVSSLSIDLTTDVVRRETPSFNVVGILPGSDPKLKNEAVVIGAHYDHLGRGGAGSLAPREGNVHYGADDNASGVAGLIELARMFSTQRPKPRRTIVFIAFSGEEEGLIGSNYYVNHPVVPLANTVAMINLDMVGRLKDDKLVIGGIGTSSEWRALVNDQNVAADLKTAHVTTGSPSSARPFALTLNEDGYGPSDHSSFYAKQIPVLFFWTGTHNDYHKPSDTAEKINYEGEARIVSFVANIVRQLDKNDKRPTYTVAKSASAGRSTGFRVYLGTIPNYADSNDGLKLDGVRDDSPAAKAGLRSGDKIVRIGTREVKNVYDYTYALGEMKADQEYEIEVVRGSERLKLKITPEARK